MNSSVTRFSDDNNRPSNSSLYFFHLCCWGLLCPPSLWTCTNLIFFLTHRETTTYGLLWRDKTRDFPTPLTTHHHDSPCTPYLPFLDRLCWPHYRGRIPITVDLRRLHSSVSSELEVHVLYEFIQNLRVLVVHRCLLLIDKVRVKVKTYLCVRNSTFGKELCHHMSRDTRDWGPESPVTGVLNTPVHLHKPPSFCNLFFIMNR